MIKLSFMMQKEIMNFTVDKREIWYSDRIFRKALKIIPTDEEFMKKIRESRNKIPAWFIKSFNLSEQDKKEYDIAVEKGEDALADNIIKDCKLKGLVLIKREKTENAINT
jgi:hypothetical protein